MLRRLIQEESAQMLVFTAICLTILMGFTAFAVDVGMLLRSKRIAQAAADAAAIAGAMQLAYGNNAGCATVTCAAQTAAAADGVPSSGVTVNTAPTDGYHTGAGYVEVITTLPNPTFFISAFKGQNTTFNVTARAVAGLPPSPACMYVLDTTDSDSFYIKGKGSVTAPACGIQVNSKSQSATCNQGAAQVFSPFLHIVGGQDTSGPCKKTPNTDVVTGVAPSGDPFTNLTGPTKSSDCTTYDTSFTSGSGTKKNPYSNEISGNLAGPGPGNTYCYANAVSVDSGTVFGPGTYVFFNGVTLNGTVTVNSGTLDIAQGTFTQGNAQLSITAPTSGTYNGIALMQPSTNTTASSCDTSAPCMQVQFGSGNENLTGIIYAPTSELYMQDEGGGVQVAGVVAYQLYVNTQLSLTDNYNVENASTSPLNKVTLVE